MANSELRKKIRIAFYPGYEDMMQNHVFDVGSEVSKNLGGLPVMNRYAALKQYLAERGVEINTYDRYKNFREVDLWIVMEPTLRQYFFLVKHLINPRKVLFFVLEPDIVNPWGWKYLKYYRFLHKTFLSWSSDLAKKYPQQFVEFKVPVPFDASRHAHFVAKKKKKLCVLMQSNKYSPVPGELYSLRREIIRHFEKRGDHLLDLYGPGWNTEDVKGLGRGVTPFHTNLYQGFASDKWETFSEYWFAFCIQNSIPAGDFEYDPFMAMATGTVPIYLPPPNVRDYIPYGTYIDYSRFKDLDDLVVYLQSIIGTDEYEAYRRRGWAFITSEQYRPFTTEQFCEDVHRAIKQALA